MSVARELRRHAATLLLLLLVVVAGAFVFVFDRDAVSTQESELRKKNLFEAWRIDDVTEMRIVTTRGPVTLRRGDATEDAGDSDGRFEVTLAGERYAGNEQTIDQYMGQLEFAVFERRIASEDGDRAAFGLDAPRIIIDVEMGRLSQRLTIGGPAPVPAGASYAEVAGRGVFVVTRELVAALDVDPDSFRSRRFVPYLSVDLDAIQIDGEGGPRRLVRAPWGGTGGSGFRIDPKTSADAAPELGPVAGARINDASLDLMLASLGSMEAEAFLSDEEAARAATRAVTLTFVPKDASLPKGVIEVGGVCPKRAGHVVATRLSPTRASVCVSEELLASIAMPIGRLIDRKLVAARVDEITEVKLVEGDRVIDLARSGHGFHQRAPEERDVPAEIGRGFIEGIARTQLTRFTTGDAAALGLEPPRATVRVVSVGKTAADDGSHADRVETIEIGRTEGDVAYVRRLEDGALCEIAADAVANLLPTDLALRPRAIFNQHARNLRAIRIEAIGAATQAFERDEDGRFTLTSPKDDGLQVDQTLADEVAAALGDLEAESFVRASDDGSFGLSEPRVKVTATVAADDDPDAPAAPTSILLSLGAATRTGSYAKRGGDDAVFTVAKSFEDKLNRLVIDRAIPSIDLADAAKIVLAADGGARRVTIARPDAPPDGPFRIAGESGATADERAALVQAALADLGAEAAVSTGPAEKGQGFERPVLTIAVTPRAAGAKVVRLAIGAGDAYRGVSVYYVRREGFAATFAVAQSKVRPLLDAVR